MVLKEFNNNKRRNFNKLKRKRKEDDNLKKCELLKKEAKFEKLVLIGSIINTIKIISDENGIFDRRILSEYYKFNSIQMFIVLNSLYVKQIEYLTFIGNDKYQFNYSKYVNYPKNLENYNNSVKNEKSAVSVIKNLFESYPHVEFKATCIIIYILTNNIKYNGDPNVYLTVKTTLNELVQLGFIIEVENGSFKRLSPLNNEKYLIEENLNEEDIIKEEIIIQKLIQMKYLQN